MLHVYNLFYVRDFSEYYEIEHFVLYFAISSAIPAAGWECVSRVVCIKYKLKSAREGLHPSISISYLSVFY